MTISRSWRSQGLLAAGALTAIVLIVLGGYGYYVRERRALVQVAAGTIDAISDLKVQQVLDWVADVNGLVEAVSGDPFLPGQVAAALRDSASYPATVAWLGSLTRGRHVDAMYVLGPGGHVRVSWPPDAPREDPELDEAVVTARTTGRPVWKDIHRDGNRVFLDCVLPITPAWASRGCSADRVPLAQDESRAVALPADPGLADPEPDGRDAPGAARGGCGCLPQRAAPSVGHGAQSAAPSDPGVTARGLAVSRP